MKIVISKHEEVECDICYRESTIIRFESIRMRRDLGDNFKAIFICKDCINKAKELLDAET